MQLPVSCAEAGVINPVTNRENDPAVIVLH